MRAMSDEPFKYDVAFSFCQEDEPQALELNDPIQDRFSNFLYSKRQMLELVADRPYLYNPTAKKLATKRPSGAI